MFCSTKPFRGIDLFEQIRSQRVGLAVVEFASDDRWLVGDTPGASPSKKNLARPDWVDRLRFQLFCRPARTSRWPAL